MTTDLLTNESFLTGTLIREPIGAGAGYWVGAPGAFFDRDDGTFYLTYRIRRPRGVDPDRGGEARIARSNDGLIFDDIWSVTKDAYHTTSIERSAIHRGPDGRWRYFTSYVDPADGRWCVAAITAPSIAELDPANLVRVFSADEIGLEGVKDPYIFEHDGRFCMFVSVAERTGSTGGDAHATHDIYNTGQCVSATGLATSDDLDRWQWQGVVFRPESNAVGKAWDGYCRRINSVVKAGDLYVGFYDGSIGHEQNYEECTGVAESADLLAWRSRTPHSPAVVAHHAGGSIRYVDALTDDQRAYVYYEMARPDGSHELRGFQTDVRNLVRIA